MQYLDNSFEELRDALKNNKKIHYGGGDPVFYLVFSVKEMLTVKNKMSSWIAILKSEGFEPQVLSLANTIDTILRGYPLLEQCVESEKDDPFQFEEINQTIKDILLEDKSIIHAITEKLQHLSNNGILLLTDVEALHPYLHISAIESELIGKIHKPTIIFYPGKRIGKDRLSFLGIHSPLGNYRSTHIGEQ
jgi:hypothetical protein